MEMYALSGLGEDSIDGITHTVHPLLLTLAKYSRNPCRFNIAEIPGQRLVLV